MSDKTVNDSSVILAGPFIGELWWEIYHFAGHVLYHKYLNPQYKLIVFTRKSRFDIYGRLADILIPLELSKDNVCDQNCFTLKGISERYYQEITKQFFSSYSSRFKVKKHLYPDISPYFYSLKWQFPRNEFIYDFKPRLNNLDVVSKMIPRGTKFALTDLNDIKDEYIKDYKIIGVSSIIQEFEYKKKARTSELGVIIELIKQCKFFIGNISSVLARLALIVNVPVVCLYETIQLPEIRIISKSPVFICYNIFEGVEQYENYIRFEKNRVR